MNSLMRYHWYHFNVVDIQLIFTAHTGHTWREKSTKDDFNRHLNYKLRIRTFAKILETMAIDRYIYIYTHVLEIDQLWKNDINWWLSKLSKFGHVWRRFRSAVLGHWVAGAVRPWHWRRSIRICLGSKPGCGGSKMATWAQIDCQSERYRKRNGMTLTHTHTMHHNAMLIYFEEFSSDSV